MPRSPQRRSRGRSGNSFPFKSDSLNLRCKPPRNKSYRSITLLLHHSNFWYRLFCRLTPENIFSICLLMPLELTYRQKQSYDFLLKSIREKGYAPSIPEIGARFKIASTNGVSDHLKALEKKGYIRRVGKRAIEVLSAVGKPALTAMREIPIVGRVPAGKPFLSEENIEGLMTISNDMGSGKLLSLQEQ